MLTVPGVGTDVNAPVTGSPTYAVFPPRSCQNRTFPVWSSAMCTATPGHEVTGPHCPRGTVSAFVVNVHAVVDGSGLPAASFTLGPPAPPLTDTV